MAQNVTVPPFDTAPQTVVGATPQAVFAFDFPFWDAADLIVDLDGVALDPSLYTVEGYFVQNGDPVEGGYGSGQVTLSTPVSNVTVTIDRYVVGAREAQFSRAAPLAMPPLNGDLNKLTARQQDVARYVRGLITAAAGSVGLAEKVDRTGENLQGAFARTFSIRQGLEPQVLDYIPTGLHSAIEAGTSTVDVADYVEAALRDGAGRFPAAQLTIGRKITVPEATGLQMRGLDPHRTRLRFTAASAGIELTFSDFNRPPIVDSIGFFTTQNSQGTALSIIGGFAVSQNRIGPQASNLRFGGATANENESGFARALLMSRVWFPRIDRVSIKGFYDGSLVYGMTTAIELDRVQAPSIKGAVLLHAQTGIRQTGNESPNPYGEGVNISDFEIVGVNTGIVLAHSGGTPGTSIHDGHINASDVGISATNHWQTTIHDLLLYKTSGPTAVDWIGLDMTDGRDCFVHHIIAGGDPTTGGHTDRAVRITRGADNKVQDVLCDTFGGNVIGVEVRDTALDTEVKGVREGVSIVGTFTPLLASGGNRGVYRDNTPLADQVFPANSATPSVENSLRDEWSTNNSSATTYTNFLNGLQGQVLEILFGPNCAIVQNANINLEGGAFTASNGSILTLKFRNGIWREVSRRLA